MIPINDAMVAYAAIIVTVALAVSLLWWSLARRRINDAYQDGHSAGIQTQIGRYQRAWNSDLTNAGITPTRVLALIDPETGADSGATLIGDRIIAAPTGAGQLHWGQIDDFPEGLPDGLREWAAHQMAATDAAAWTVAR